MNGDSTPPLSSKDRSLGPAPLPTFHGKGCICNQYPRKDCPALQTPEGQERERARELNSARCRLREAESRWSEPGGEVARLRAVLKRMSTGDVPATDFVQLSKDALVGSPDETVAKPCPVPAADGMSVDGKQLAPDVLGVGTVSWHPETQDWRCLANVSGCLCVVQVCVSPQSSEKASGEPTSGSGCPACGVMYVAGARHFSGCPLHPGEAV